MIFVGMLVGGFKSAFSSFTEEKECKVQPNSVLSIKMDQPIVERGSESPFSEFNFGGFGKQASIGLDDLLATFKRAAADSSLKGIFFDLSHDVEASQATLEEIRNAMLVFKRSSKFIYAYSETYSQKSYYLATAADKIILHPEGELTFKGLGAQVMYYKSALEKLNLSIQVFRHGRFKSAVEPFLLDKMSDANRLQLHVLLGGLWKNMLQGISKQRGIPENELQRIADELLASNPEEALKFKMVDELMYKDQAIEMVKAKIGIKESDKPRMVGLARYMGKGKNNWMKVEAEEEEEGKAESIDKLAIIYAVGNIESGKGDFETIGSETLVKALRKARKDSSVKAIVLRVNSPGGSALASDVIWREVSLAKAVKPVIVSMGDVAASGGYYISCAAHRIFAQPNTITGSIGVFGLIPNAQKLFSDKFGINVDTVNTARHSDFGSTFRSVSPTEASFVQRNIEIVYNTFTKRVAEGRGMTQAEVDSIGQGRVWSGVDALQIKLVDELGGINDAIDFAAKKANLKEGSYKIVSMPERKDPLMDFLKGKREEEESKAFKKYFGQMFDSFYFVKNILNQKGVQARVPFDLLIN